MSLGWKFANSTLTDCLVREERLIVHNLLNVVGLLNLLLNDKMIQFLDLDLHLMVWTVDKP